MVLLVCSLATSLAYKAVGASAPAATRSDVPTWYVSPHGNDRNDGSEAHPFATLDRACRASRKATAPSRRIIMRGGEYFAVSVALGETDSGLTIEAASGEKPVLYGGVALSRWQKDGDRFYAAALPPSGAFATGPRMLEVDGHLCPRARWPEDGTLPHLSHFTGNWRGATEGRWDRQPTEEELTTIKYRGEDLGSWLELTNAEVTVYHRWDESCVGVASIDTNQHLLRFTSRLAYPAGAFDVYKYVVWNIPQGMRRPGQWYHDRIHGRIVYWPLPGQDMRKVRAVVPTAEALIRLEGSASAPIRNVTLRGLTIHVTTVPLKAGGWAADSYDGAVSLRQAEGCVLDRLEVSRVCGQAIYAHEQVSNLHVENCRIGPCGAGGIYVGDGDWRHPNSQQRVYNNRVHEIGLFYPSAIGIMADGDQNVVSHNEVHGCSYTGISSGGAQNLIEDNLIYDCMRTLQDGAAIYLPAGDRCILRGNLARDISDHDDACSFYLDETSHDCLVEKNVSVDVKLASLNHLACNNTLRNNVFITTKGDLEVNFPRSIDYTLERNILWAGGDIKFTGIEGVKTWQHNLLYSAGDRITGIALDMYRPAGEVNGVVGDTVVAEPQFRDFEATDGKFQPDSPAARLGIEPVDVSGAGCVN